MTRLEVQVSFYAGKPFAAYVSFPRKSRRKVARTREVKPGILVDYDAKGHAMGVEIVHPTAVSLDDVADVVRDAVGGSIRLDDLIPLRAA